ncbi:MAG: MotA/TolQ/ExbB proton channel family protein [Planctomycetaceae bacterium]|nr:MotA/TolQ/ExbB proton channel family protein [Planctomycetaceae bacterium]
MDPTVITYWVGNLIYLALAAVAIWGAFCVIVVWRRVAQTRFRSEDEQLDFLESLEQPLLSGDFVAVEELCEADSRAMPQLVHLAVSNRQIAYAKVRALVTERFQRDVLADLEYRLSWVYTVIKTAPMLGLLGTVIGMMGAFAKLGSGKDVDPTQLAGDIMLALITTALGLSIAIPLVLSTASISVRMRKMEDLIGGGLTRFFEVFKHAPREAGE